MTSQPDDDSALVLRARSGDREAFALLYSRHLPLLCAVCRRAVGDTAAVEDIVQEAALQALLNLNALRQPARFGSWLAGIGLNLCRRWRRQRTRAAWSWEALRGGVYLHEPIDESDDPVDLTLVAELQAHVQHAVAALPTGQRAAVLLFYLSGLTQAETAELLGIPTGAVKTRLHRARAALRKQLWQTWQEVQQEGQEEHMTSQSTASLKQLRIIDVRTRRDDEGRFNPYIVVLEEIDGGRLLPIWVGPHEGVSLAVLLEKVQMPRPLTPAFMAGLLEAAGARLQEVRITRLENDTYFAEAAVTGPQGLRTVDARPSDALMLALAAGAPVYAEGAVLERAGAPRDELHQRLPAAETTMNASAIVARLQAEAERRQQELEQLRAERERRSDAGTA